jgi:hypothetical protein
MRLRDFGRDDESSVGADGVRTTTTARAKTKCSAVANAESFAPLRMTNIFIDKIKPGFRLMRRPGFLVCESELTGCGYLTTDWKSGEVRRLANWLSEEE